MKIKLGLKATVYKVNEKTFTDLTGKEIPYYQAVIEQNGDIESLGITAEAKDKIKPMEVNQMICELDTVPSYNKDGKPKAPKLRVVDVVTK